MGREGLIPNKAGCCGGRSPTPLCTVSVLCVLGRILRVLLPHFCVNNALTTPGNFVCPGPSLRCFVSIAETKGNQACVTTKCCELAFGKEALVILGWGVCLGVPDSRLKLEKTLVLNASA